MKQLPSSHCKPSPRFPSLSPFKQQQNLVFIASKLTQGKHSFFPPLDCHHLNFLTTYIHVPTKVHMPPLFPDPFALGLRSQGSASTSSPVLTARLQHVAFTEGSILPVWVLNAHEVWTLPCWVPCLQATSTLSVAA